jgi:deazaflavin-dependent oxidoreductase (nitroreductase family)
MGRQKTPHLSRRKTTRVPDASRRLLAYAGKKRNHKKEAEMSQTTQTPTVPPLVTQAMKLVLRSPVHGMVSKTVLLITFTGRKSGKTYTTPVDYSQDGDQVTIFSHANWWKNLRNGAPVTLRMRGRELQGLAEPVAEDKQAVAAGLTEHLRKVPSDARYYGVTFDDHGNPRAEEVERAAQNVVMIRIQLC